MEQRFPYSDFMDDKFGSDYLQSMLNSDDGRDFILKCRVAEKHATYSLNEMYPDEQSMQSSMIYDSHTNSPVVTSPREGTSFCQGIQSPQKTVIGVLMDAIADVEWLLINHHKDLNEEQKISFESTRRNDLILLRKTIEQENRPYMRDHLTISMVYETFFSLNMQWPPEENSIYSKISAFKVLYWAIERYNAQVKSEIKFLEQQIEVDWQDGIKNVKRKKS